MQYALAKIRTAARTLLTQERGRGLEFTMWFEGGRRGLELLGFGVETSGIGEGSRFSATDAGGSGVSESLCTPCSSYIVHMPILPLLSPGAGSLMRLFREGSLLGLKVYDA